MTLKVEARAATVTPHILKTEDSPSGVREEGEEEEEENHFRVHAESSFNLAVELPLGCISDTESLRAKRVCEESLPTWKNAQSAVGTRTSLNSLQKELKETLVF